MKLSRSIHLNRLIAAKHDNFVKIITGIRRCGKSYLLFELFKEHLLSEGVPPECIVEINLEQDGFKELRDPIALGDYIRSRIESRGDRWMYVMIDEIQLCRKVLPPGTDLSLIHPDDRESAFVTFYDVLSELKNLPRVDAYVTGSNSKMLSTDVATQFRDRGEVIHVRPLSFAEFVEARGGRENVYRHLIDYLSYGGLPEAVLRPAAAARRYLAGLYGTVYLKDIAERNKLRNDSLLEALADTVMSSAAGLTNPTKLAKTVKSVLGVDTNPVTVRKYLGYFENAFLVEKALRWDVKGRGNKSVSRFCIPVIPSGKSSLSTTPCKRGHTTTTASPTWGSSTSCSTRMRWTSADSLAFPTSERLFPSYRRKDSVGPSERKIGRLYD